MPDVVCLGEVIIDMIAMDSDVGLGGTRAFYKSPGGATANVAVGVCRLGGSSRFLGVVADDPFGRYLLDALKTEGVDTAFMKTRSGERSVVGFIARNSDQSKDVIFYRDPQSEMFLLPDEINLNMFDSAQILHFGIICLRTEQKLSATQKAVQMAREKGLLISFDLNYRPHAWPSCQFAQERLLTILSQIDILKMAEEELPLLFPQMNEKTAIDMLLEKGVNIVIISRGERGSSLFRKEFKIDSPPFRVEAVETTGAGDTFMAGMLVGITKKNTRGEGRPRDNFLNKNEMKVRADLMECMPFANAAGALTCTRPGAIIAIPSREEIKEKFNLKV
ncbi:MAG TPA: carbohydrate kinase [Candidatus Sumerlaeota bacterium]|nr:carbohydrate kinase [Candidatus Sumerlaeota bacterium]HRR32025.1 carbohydrate kinase [Candidatus Sumerlaeia bacterium]HON51003.1 carbohydrate kinase [Candidatus Sumerlaeota bacterium]HOR63757.1 carbohydrate kinase [Candidatus Sumerlaeota bacterium]HPL74491.1 carbohydrate kinase [Candidatus Sumerlaeota bacterium]